MTVWPASARRSRSASFVSVESVRASDCRPSRGATSTSWIRGCCIRCASYGAPRTRPSRILPRVERIPGNIRRRAAFAGPPELARFFKGARLETMPAKMPERSAVLAYVAECFEPGRDYAEAEVNVMLARVQDDFATLRRYLIDAGLLRRERGTYRRA